MVFAADANQPSFNFWQRDNWRRYADAKAIVVATLDLSATDAYRTTRETYWDSTATARRRAIDEPKPDPDGVCRQ